MQLYCLKWSYTKGEFGPLGVREKIEKALLNYSVSLKHHRNSDAINECGLNLLKSIEDVLECELWFLHLEKEPLLKIGDAKARLVFELGGSLISHHAQLLACCRWTFNEQGKMGLGQLGSDVISNICSPPNMHSCISSAHHYLVC